MRGNKKLKECAEFAWLLLSSGSPGDGPLRLIKPLIKALYTHTHTIFIFVVLYSLGEFINFFYKKKNAGSIWQIGCITVKQNESVSESIKKKKIPTPMSNATTHNFTALVISILILSYDCLHMHDRRIWMNWWVDCFCFMRRLLACPWLVLCLREERLICNDGHKCSAWADECGWIKGDISSRWVVFVILKRQKERKRVMRL